MMLHIIHHIVQDLTQYTRAFHTSSHTCQVNTGQVSHCHINLRKSCHVYKLTGGCTDAHCVLSNPSRALLTMWYMCRMSCRACKLEHSMLSQEQLWQRLSCSPSGRSAFPPTLSITCINPDAAYHSPSGPACLHSTSSCIAATVRVLLALIL